MNANRRKRIAKAVATLRELHEQLSAVQTEIDEISVEERDALEAKPESLQTDEADEIAQTLDDASSELGDSVSNLIEMIERLEGMS